MSVMALNESFYTISSARFRVVPLQGKGQSFKSIMVYFYFSEGPWVSSSLPGEWVVFSWDGRSWLVCELIANG